MTDVWMLPNGNYVRRCEGDYAVYKPGSNSVEAYLDSVPADAVPLVPESGRRVTGQELYEARFGHGLRPGDRAIEAWNGFAERLNLRVPVEREPWDVLREAADIVGGATGCELHREADRLEREAAEKSQREAEVEKALKAWHHVEAESLAEDSDELERECMRAALDAVRGDSDE